jgi:hypothetical protein
MYALSRATGTPFFKGTITEWNPAQVEFTKWCEFYYHIAQDTERPDEKTIQDDFVLDSWIAKRQYEIRKQALEAKHENIRNQVGKFSEKEEFTF